MRKLLFLPLLFSLLSGCGNVRTDQMRTLLHEQDSLNRAYQHLSLDTIYQLTDYFDRHGPNYDRVHSHYLHPPPSTPSSKPPNWPTPPPGATPSMPCWRRYMGK